MTDAVAETLVRHAQKIEFLTTRHEETTRRIAANEQRMERLDDAMADLRERFGSVATHDDVQALHTKIDSSINGLLKDALAAVPGKIALLFAGAMALTSVITLVAYFARVGH